MGNASSGLHLLLRQDTPIPLDAEITAAPGELVALVGPSGSGKTTILRSIAGLSHPGEGRITCNGTTWLDTGRRISLPPQRRSVGFVFQHYALFPHMTAQENVEAALGHRPAAERRERATELLDLVHLTGLDGRRPAELSGGQQQRVAVARALARDPAVLLLDEPFSAVDQVTRRKLQRELAQLRQRLNIPIVLVTHDLEEAVVLADRLCILHHGRVLQDGPPTVVMARPRSRQVARLVGLQNVFEAMVLEHRPESGITVLHWLDRDLEAALDPTIPPGAKVWWLIPPGHVYLHRQHRPSSGDHENPVAGTISEIVRLGESTSVVLRIGDRDDSPLSFSVPTHVAERNHLTIGEQATVSLLRAAIHLMPWNDQEPETP